MPPSQQWKSNGAKTSTSSPFEVQLGNEKTKYTLKTETNITNGQVGSSKLTLQDTVSGRTGETPRALASSTDGGKTWIPEKDSEGKSIINSTQLAALYPGNKLYTAAKNAAKIDAKLNGASDNQLQQLDNGNAATTNTPTDKQGSPPLSKELVDDFNKERESIKSNQRANYESAIYPLSLKSQHQDCIKFSIIKYQESGLKGFGPGNQNLRIVNVEEGKPKIGTREILATIVLPIPGGIQDGNQVNWSGLELNDIQQAFGNLAQTGIMGGDMLKEAQKSAEEAAKPGSGVRTALITKLTESAISSGGLMQRQFGTIINPNLELLFNSPTLRTFTFSFKLSPRSEDEAAEVKKIIRNFKQSMSVKRSKSSFLLQSPHTFAISYIFRDKQHPYLNKFKECALTNCSVNYTPEGNYMAFDSLTNPSMVSYQLDLQFQELEPLYDDDYGTDNYVNIGY